jgi:hypothetical protein
MQALRTARGVAQLFRILLFPLISILACSTALYADTLTVGGIINQSTQDGTGPAVNNPSLNNISDGSSFVVGLSFVGSIPSPGTYQLIGPSLFFSVAADGALENNFDSVSVTVATAGSFDQISILACLTTGSGCNQGNELALDFMIASVDLNSQNAVAQGILNLLPLDLLEDDGVTDIHGSITDYSYTSVSPVPEPSAFAIAVSGLLVMALGFVKGRKTSR